MTVGHIYVPQHLFLTKGVGRHKEMLSSFEFALRDAGIARFNLVTVSSIFPPRAKIISRRQGERMLKDRIGGIVCVVMSRTETNEPHRLIAASLGVAVPRDRDMHGYLAEHHAFGQKERQAGDYAEDLAAGMLANTLGIPFDVDADYDERREQYKIGGHIVSTRNVTQSAVGDKHGLWTTVMAGAVLL